MFWWLVVAAGICVALVYAYREHRRENRRLATLFVGFAAFTFIELEMPGDAAEKIRIRPQSTGTRKLELPVTSGGRLSTGDREFDAAFRIAGNNQAFASSLLGVDVRRSMLASDTPVLESRVERNKITVTMDGIAGSTKEIEVLIETAGLLADHCPLVGSTAD